MAEKAAHTWGDLSGQHACVIVNPAGVNQQPLRQPGNLLIKPWHEIVHCLHAGEAIFDIRTRLSLHSNNVLITGQCSHAE